MIGLPTVNLDTAVAATLMAFQAEVNSHRSYAEAVSAAKRLFAGAKYSEQQNVPSGAHGARDHVLRRTPLLLLRGFVCRRNRAHQTQASLPRIGVHVAKLRLRVRSMQRT